MHTLNLKGNQTLCWRVTKLLEHLILFCNHIFIQLRETFRKDAFRTLRATPQRADYRDYWNETQTEVSIEMHCKHHHNTSKLP